MVWKNVRHVMVEDETTSSASCRSVLEPVGTYHPEERGPMPVSRSCSEIRSP